MSQFTASMSSPVLVGDVSISLLARTISVNSNINSDILYMIVVNVRKGHTRLFLF